MNFIFSLVNASLGRSELFYLTVARAALLGVSWWSGSSSNKFYLPYGPYGLCSGIFSFIRYIVQHLRYFIFLDSNPCPIWTPLWLARFSFTHYLVGPLSALEGSPFNCPVFPTSLEGDPQWSGELDVCSHVTWSWVFVLIFLAVSLFSSVSLVHLVDIVWWSSCRIIFFPRFPSDKWDPELVGPLSALEGSPFNCPVFPTSLEGDPQWSGELDVCSHVTWSWVFVLIFLAVSLFSSVSLVHLVDIVWWSSCRIIFFPRFPSDKWDPEFLEGLLHDCERCPWESLPYLLISSYLDEKILVGWTSLLYEGISFLLSCFLFFCKGG